jgi:phosphatidyl-myo-inositol alpha-mannosyltransferase
MIQYTIGLVCPYSFAANGGVQEHTLNLARGLKELGHKVVFISPNKSAEISLLPHVQLGISTRLPTPNGSWAEMSIANQTKQEIQEVVAKYSIDIFHFQELVVPFSAWFWLKHSPLINVVTYHSGWEANSTRAGFFSVFLHYLKRQSFSYIDNSITVSSVAAQCNKILLKNNQIIPPAINIDLIKKKRAKPPTLDQTKFNLVCIGRLEQRKGVPYLIHALAKLPKKILNQTTTHIIGDGPDKAAILNLIDEKKLNTKVLLHGSLTQEEKLSFLQHCTALIAPATHGESFGIVLIEALAAGCPVIAGNNIGYLTTLSDYPYQEYILNPSQADLFAERITQLLTHPAEQQTIKRWSKSFVKLFDHRSVAKKHIALYQELLLNKKVLAKPNYHINILRPLFSRSGK